MVRLNCVLLTRGPSLRSPRVEVDQKRLAPAKPSPAARFTAVVVFPHCLLICDRDDLTHLCRS
jgi:hypothetical protein